MREPCVFQWYCDPDDPEGSDLFEAAGYVRSFAGSPEFGSHFKALVEHAVTGELTSEDIDTVTMLGMGDCPYGRPRLGEGDRKRWFAALGLAEEHHTAHERRRVERKAKIAQTVPTNQKEGSHGE